MEVLQSNNVVALSVLILFAVFIAYEVAGGSPNFPDLHTVSFFASRILWVKIVVVAFPPLAYIIWILWHLAHFVPK